MEYAAIEKEIRQQCNVLNWTNVEPTDLYISWDIFTEMRRYAGASQIWYDSLGKWTYRGLKIYLVTEPGNNLENHIEVT